MLQAIRDRATGWIAWIIIIMITIPFALWGVNEYLNDGVKLYAASVNKQEISLADFQQAYNNYRQQMRQMFGQSFAPDASMESSMKRRILDGLVEQELLFQTIYDRGLRIGDAQLAARIHAISAFEVDGQFNVERYQQVLAAQGMNVAQFEEQMRRDMVVNQFRASIKDSAIITDRMLEQIWALQQQKRDISYLKLPIDGVDSIEINAAEVEKFYKDNQRNYMTPAKGQFEYIELTASLLEKQATIAEDDLKTLYDDLKQSRFSVEEQRKASHILIQVAQDADQATVKAAKDKIDALSSQLTVDNFATLAQENSEDTVSAAQGGDLGFFGKGLMTAEFEQQAFKMKRGEISQVIRSPFGFHIIYLTDIKPGYEKPFADVKAELETILRQREAEQQFYDQAEQLETLVYENPDSLEMAAETLGLKVQSTDWIANVGTKDGIFSEKKVLKAAFSDDVLAGNNSSAIELAGDHVVVIRINEYQASEPRPLDEIREEITKQLKADKAKSQKKEQVDALLARLKAGESLEVIAKELSLEIVKAGFIGRDDKKVDRMLRESAFRLAKPVAASKHYSSPFLSSGEYALLVLNAVKSPTITDMTSDERSQLRTRLENETTQTEFEGLVSGLRQHAKIVENMDEL